MALPDVLAPSLRVVFCGTAAGTKSAQKHAYYAGPGNRFWHVLHQTQMTTRELEPHEYLSLLDYGIGLTDVCKTTAGMDSEIPIGAFDPAGLKLKVAELKPCAIAFNGKTAARVALGLKHDAPIDCGLQPDLLAGAAVWVLSSTSGAASGYWDVQPWQTLANSLPALAN